MDLPESDHGRSGPSLQRQLAPWPAKADAPALVVDLQDRNLDHVAYVQLNRPWKLAAVQQAIMFHTDIDERAKVNNIAHGALQQHPLRQIIHCQNIAA